MQRLLISDILFASRVKESFFRMAIQTSSSIALAQNIRTGLTRSPVRWAKSLVRSLAVKLARRIYDMAQYAVEQDLPHFANQPRNVRIEMPRRLDGAEHMEIGDDVAIGPGSLLVAQTEYPSLMMQHPERPVPVQRFKPKLVVGNRVTATGNLTLDAMQEIVVEDDVMFASNVTVIDGLHGFARVDIPYKYQPLWRIAPVRVGRGSWIAPNVVIMPGVSIGEMCIIGANSIVTCDIPPRSIAFGNPARVVKRWDETTSAWVAVGTEDAPIPQ
jgi:acetyltransferase-like isoleucine patch superfamily enzyme